MTWRRASTALACALLCAAISPARATVAASASLEELAACADVIVDARVLETATRLREQRGRPMAFTFHRLHVLERLHGDAADELTVMEPGGSTAQGTTELVGAPRYVRGERVLAFLTKSRERAGVLRTCGLAQGKFIIAERAGMLTATRDLRELTLLPRTRDPLAARTGEPPWELEELKRTILSMVSAR